MSSFFPGYVQDDMDVDSDNGSDNDRCHRPTLAYSDPPLANVTRPLTAHHSTILDCWTDGSLRPATDTDNAAMGLGAHCPQLDLEVIGRLPPAPTSSLRPEIAAIIAIVDKLPAGSDVRVFSDSAVAVQVVPMFLGLPDAKAIGPRHLSPLHDLLLVLRALVKEKKLVLDL
ncbi:hypothetical protein BCR44DRAFT_53882, partial [Catenaria anguillulae PL171]